MASLPDQRALVLARMLRGRVDRKEAMLCSVYPIARSEDSCPRFVAEGPAALAHANVGRRPANATDPALAARVIAFARNGYAGINDTHLSELLAEREGIVLSHASVQRILRGAEIARPDSSGPRDPHEGACRPTALAGT